MINPNHCFDANCPHLHKLSGQCMSTACIKPKVVTSIINDTNNTNNTNNTIVFPCTIGDIAFYSKGELIDWVITQQRWGKDPNFGAGN